tara:strand:- start:4419 stop:4769 length:351 start_codon:yes stop_codon:yes gene_type:complete
MAVRPKQTKSAKRRVARLSRKINKTNVKGKTKRATRLAKRQAKIVKTGKRGVGRAVDKVKKAAKRVAGSKLGKIVTAASKVYSNVKKGKVKGAIDSGKKLVTAVKSKRSYPRKRKS